MLSFSSIWILPKATLLRSANCDECHLDGDHPPDEHRPPRPLRHHHLLHHRARAVHGGLPQNLLRCYHRCGYLMLGFKNPFLLFIGAKKEKHLLKRKKSCCANSFASLLQSLNNRQNFTERKKTKNKICKSLRVEHGKAIIRGWCWKLKKAQPHWLAAKHSAVERKANGREEIKLLRFVKSLIKKWNVYGCTTVGFISFNFTCVFVYLWTPWLQSKMLMLVQPAVGFISCLIFCLLTRCGLLHLTETD